MTIIGHEKIPPAEKEKSMASRLACCAGLFALILGIGDSPSRHCHAQQVPEYFHSEPDDSLIRQLVANQGASTESSSAGATRQYRFVPELGVLLIDGVQNGSDGAATGDEFRSALDWTLRVFDRPDAANYRELSYRQDHWYGSTYWTGPNWTRVGNNWHHPGLETPSVRRFVAPRDGRVTITGRVYKAHLDGDGVRVSIRHGMRTLWTADIQGQDAVGQQPRLTLDVRQGDSIRFVVHKLGGISCDTTRWDPVVAYADGPRCQAADDFSTTKQGQGGWYYEMEVDPLSAPPGLPRIHGLTTDLTLLTEALNPGTETVFKGQQMLPLVIVADGADRSGMVLAFDCPGPWQFAATMTIDGLLQLKLTTEDAHDPRAAEPGRSRSLPRIAIGAYRGPWLEGMALLERVARCDGHDLPLAELGQTGHAELTLMAMVQDAWSHEDQLDGTAKSYPTAIARHLHKAALLLADLRHGRGDDFLAAEARQLDQLAAAATDSNLAFRDWRSLYQRVRRLKRAIALANPLMQFGQLLFCKRAPTSYSHLVMQYYGWRARAGGGLFVLDQPGRSLACRDLTGGKLNAGNVLEPRLSYDAKRIVFSYVECQDQSYDPSTVDNNRGGGYYHVWEVNVDGSGLRQLTRGNFDDLMPTYLPDRGIAFSSTRRLGYARCFGNQFSQRWDVYTLHRMDGDGQNMRLLSCHDTNEWFPSVTNDGRILYARWDYIDRDAVTHQNLWATRPDGTGTSTVWGNATPSPHCSFQAKPIPGTGKFVFTASAHHSITAGSIAVVDPSVDYDGQEALTRITPEIPFPEAESRDIREYYTSPWPLSESYFLVGYSRTPLVWEPGANSRNALGIYLLDKFGNRELLYRDPTIGSTNPTPLAARGVPEVLASILPDDPPPTGAMHIMDVYRGLGGVARGSIKQIRIIQIFPKTTPWANNPPMGVAGEENGRAILGTVPVAADGSALFTVPALKPLLFQALDQDGCAYQTMRSVAYVQPGELISCVGCHENRLTVPPPAATLAMAREPSTIDPGPLGGRPFSFVEMVQPVLDKHCVECHGGDKIEGHIDLTATVEGAWTKSYGSLTRDATLVPRFPQRNQIQVTPSGGQFGALGSGLMKLLRQGHEGVQLSADEIRRLAAWIDCNAIFYGTPNPADQAKQLRGEAVAMPEIQ
jgi:hydrazine synthase alpha subunit-like protein